MANMHCCTTITSPSTYIPRHILVTGGAGFIGANFVHFLASQHPQTHITVLDALTYAGNYSSISDISPSILTFIQGDICDEPLVERLVTARDTAYARHGIPPIDAIVHFAAESHNDNSIVNADPFIRTNVVGTLSLLKVAARHDIRFHHISTDEVYGDLPLEGTDSFTEDSPYRPSSPYSASKAASDHLVRAWVRTYGLRATISNCGNNYGPFQHIEKFIPRQITNILTGITPKLYGQGLEIRDWIHVEDHCSAIWEILIHGRIGGTYLIGANCTFSNITVMRSILHYMGQPEDAFAYVSNRPGVDRRYALNTVTIQKELHWRPMHTDFISGLQDTISWYRTHRSWWENDKQSVEHLYTLQGH